MEKVLLIGGPGNISGSTVNELLVKGFEVGIFTLPVGLSSNPGEKVKLFLGNRDNQEELRAAADTFRPDIVIDFVCFRPDQAKSAVEIMCGKVSQYIFISTVDVYGYPLSNLPMRETDLKRKGNCKYATDKMECEEIFLSAGKDKFPLTIARPVYSFGPGFVLDLLSRKGGKYMIPRLRAGKPILVPGGGNTLIHVSSAYNTGRMIAQLAGHHASIGKVYNCGHPAPMTHDEYVGLFAGVLGVEPKLVHIPFEILLSLGMPEIDDEILPILSRFNLFFSIAEFSKEFPEYKWELSLEDAAKQYVEHNDRIGYFDDPNTENFEDRIIRAWLDRVDNFKNI